MARRVDTDCLRINYLNGNLYFGMKTTMTLENLNLQNLTMTKNDGHMLQMS